MAPADWKKVANPGSAIGEAVGKLFEHKIRRLVQSICFDLPYYVDVGGPRPEIGRKGKKIVLYDLSKVSWENDIVIEDEDHNPVILIEAKWLRYTKHCRDKGGWVCTAHSSLRKSHDTIRKTVVTLAGSWTQSSISMMEGNYVDVHLVKYDYIVELLGQYGIPFHWDEKDRETAFLAWEKWNQLSTEQTDKIGDSLILPIESSLTSSLLSTLKWSGEPKITQFEVTFRTDDGGSSTRFFQSLDELINFFSSFD
jgi:hypothetical protein